MGNYFVDMYIRQSYGIGGIMVNNIIAMLVPILVEDLKFENPKSAGIFALKVVGTVIVMNCLCALSSLLLGHIAMSQLCGAILVAIYLLIFSKARPLVRLCTGCSFVAIIEIVPVDCFSVFDIMSELGTTNGSLFVDLLMLIFLVGGVCFIKVFSLKKFNEVIPSSVGIIVGASVVCTVFWVITNITVVDAVARLTIGLILFALLLGLNYGAYAISGSVEESRRAYADKLMREADKNMLAVVERNMQELRKVRHEIDNQYAYMSVLLKDKEYSKLDRYFSEYSEKLSPLLSVVDCGNRVVSAVINLELSKATSEGVTIEYELSVPSELPFTDSDVCSLLFNMLNNAIEYLCRRRETDRTVKFSLRLINRTLLVKCENAIEDGDIENAKRLHTSKSDPSLHGYGSKVIGSIAEKYNGSVKYDIKDGRFLISVALFEPDNFVREDKQ